MKIFFDTWWALEGIAELSYRRKLFEAIILVRLLKLATMLNEMPQLRSILKTIENLLRPLIGLLTVELILIYAFSVIGMYCFGGKVSPDNPFIKNNQGIPPNYYLLNFNDYFSAWITLYSVLVVNNWQLISLMYECVLETRSVRLYFLIFYYCVVIVGMNILLATTIDMYSAVLRMEQKTKDNFKILKR